MNRVEACFRLAEAAGQLLSERLGKVPTRYKAELDPVTEADLAAEAFLKGELLGQFPGDGFLGEEGAAESSRSGFLWVADPLDGTLNFAHGHPDFCISLGLLKEGQPIAGCIVRPGSGEAWQAEQGSGAFRSGQRIGVSHTPKLAAALASTDFPYDREARLGRGLQRLEALITHCEMFRVRGSCALELCRIAEGSADLFLGDGTHAWDLAAGALILKEAGGCLTDWTGRPLDLLADCRWPLATNGILHAEALEMTRTFLG